MLMLCSALVTGIFGVVAINVYFDGESFAESCREYRGVPVKVESRIGYAVCAFTKQRQLPLDFCKSIQPNRQCTYWW